jgi:metallophosphoesterase (TIGR00282 family)
MPSRRFRIVFIGDIIGKYGRRFIGKALPLIKIKFEPDVVIANGENVAGGLGITEKTAFEIFEFGVDVITGGNHIWDKKEALNLLKENRRIIRPLNFPQSVPGTGYTTIQNRNGLELLVVNLQGRVFMEPVVDNPFLAMDKLLDSEGHKLIFVDFHAEATAEKQALGFYLNGRVSAVLGTHTHVQTTDLKILSEGTAYQTDVGMTGAYDSVIGMKTDPVIKKFITGINHRFEVAKENVIMDFTIIDIQPGTGKSLHVECHRIFDHSYEKQLDF